MAARNERSWVGSLMLASWLIQISGCGTIFFPERKGQPAGRLDPKVVVLDAVGLLLFFIPGVIAFAVDFNNGTIYLPPDSHGNTEPQLNGWTSIKTSSKSPNAEEIQQIVKQKTGKTVPLRPGRYRAGQLHSITELTETNFDSVELATVCEATDVRFRSQSE